MEALGVLFTFLNSIVFYSLKIYRDADNILEGAKQSIKDEYCRSQEEFGHIVSSYDVNKRQLEESVNRLKIIHFHGHTDTHLLRMTNKELQIMLSIAFMGFVIVLISLIVGLVSKQESVFWDYRNILIMIIPSIWLFFEISILLRFLFLEKRMKQIKSKYINREY